MGLLKVSIDMNGTGGDAAKTADAYQGDRASPARINDFYAGANSVKADDFYKDKSVRFVVGFAAGGGDDLYTL